MMTFKIENPTNENLRIFKIESDTTSIYHLAYYVDENIDWIQVNSIKMADGEAICDGIMPISRQTMIDMNMDFIGSDELVDEVCNFIRNKVETYDEKIFIDGHHLAMDKTPSMHAGDIIRIDLHKEENRHKPFDCNKIINKIIPHILSWKNGGMIDESN